METEGFSSEVHVFTTFQSHPTALHLNSVITANHRSFKHIFRKAIGTIKSARISAMSNGRDVGEKCLLQRKKTIFQQNTD